MSARLWAILTALSGAATLALFVGFSLLPEVKAAALCFEPTAITKFELARNVDELRSLFGLPGSACRPLMIHAMDGANHLDVTAFIPAYAAFCCCMAVFIGGAVARPLVIAAFAAALIAAAGDLSETRTLLEITKGALEQADDLLARSLAGAWTKFAALALHALLIAALCFTVRPRRPILGVLMALPALGVLAMAIDQVRFIAVCGAEFALGWVPMFAVALKESVMPHRAPDAPG